MKHSTRATARRGARRPGSAYQAGAAIIEFAIVGPFALLLVMAIIQLGLMSSAKQLLNEATFVAARAGAVQNAQKDSMTQALVTALIPFYQDTLDTSPITRISSAWGRAGADLCAGGIALPCVLLPWPLGNGNLDITVLNPTAAAFTDFGLTDSNNHTYIPNDSLEYRGYIQGQSAPTYRGNTTGLTIQDANALKIRVTYAYELKVPLMQSVFKSVMCGFDSGVNAFGSGNSAPAASGNDCAEYYNRGRVPIVAYATVQMQTPAWQ